MTLKTEVRCIDCNDVNPYNFQDFKKMNWMKCKKCGQSFNLIGVWDSLYKQNDLCERIVEVATTHTNTNYKIDSTNKEETDKINDVFQNVNFSNIIRQIFFDLVIYGNSFFLIKGSGRKLTLNRLEPTKLKFKIDFVQEPPRKSYQEKIVEISDFSNASNLYDLNDIIHFKIKDMGYEPFGFSVLGMWFRDWYLLGQSKNTEYLLMTKTFPDVKLKKFVDYIESIVVAAARIPLELIFSWITIKSNSITYMSFNGDIKTRRNEVKRTIERQLFPKILERQFNVENFPTLIFA